MPDAKQSSPNHGAAAHRPMISVVMNCYNGERYLREAIDSVLGQEYSQWELVFWDNCSVDRSAEIVKSYRDPRIRYILAPQHTTLGGARRQAVDHCQGEYVSFLDCDDLYLPDNLTRKVEAIEADAAAVVYGGVIYINEQGEEKGRKLPHYQSGMIFNAMLRQFETEVPTMMIRRSVLVESGLNFDDQIYGSEEYDLLLQLAVDHRFSVMPHYVAKLRHHRSSLTYKVMAKWAEDRVRTLNKIRARHAGIEPRFPGEFQEAYARASYYRARWLVNEGNRTEGLRVLGEVAGVGWRYRAMYVALRISRGCWDLVHRFLPSSRRL